MVAPGNGTLVSAVHTAIGRLATVAGKPEAPIFEEALARFGAKKALFIGDRLDTDIMGASRSGSTQCSSSPESIDPSMCWRRPRDRARRTSSATCDELHVPYPEVTERDGVFDVNGAAVRVVGADVEIVTESGSQIDLLRAGAAAIWASGTPVFVLRVPERLYDDPFHRP